MTKIRQNGTNLSTLISDVWKLLPCYRITKISESVPIFSHDSLAAAASAYPYFLKILLRLTCEDTFIPEAISKGQVILFGLPMKCAQLAVYIHARLEPWNLRMGSSCDFQRFDPDAFLKLQY